MMIQTLHSSPQSPETRLSFVPSGSNLLGMAAVPIDPEVPLVTDPYGVVRVRGSRVSLDLIVTDYQDGATAEEIAENFTTVALSDVHLIIEHYLRHRTEIDAYLSEQWAEAEAARLESERQFSQTELYKRIMAYKEARKL